MKSFSDWTRGVAEAQKGKVAPTVENPAKRRVGGIYQAPCRGCGKYFDIEGDFDNFDPKMHWCGRSQFCCP